MQWRFADLSVASDVPLSDLPRTPAPPDIVIERGPFPQQTWTLIQTWDDERGVWLSIERSVSGYRLTFPDLICVVSADGARVTYGAAPADAAHLLVHQVLPLAVSRRGRMVLHACAVDTPRGVIALVGESGAGKSTLAAALCARGLALVADDALVVDLDARAAYTWPTASGLRMWEDVAAAWPAALQVASASPGQKWRVRAPLASARAPLARIVLVGATIPDRIEVTPVSPAPARMEILPHLFRLDVTSDDESRVLFERVHTLCERVPVRRIAYPDGIERLDAVAAAVLQDLERP